MFEGNTDNRNMCSTSLWPLPCAFQLSFFQSLRIAYHLEGLFITDRVPQCTMCCLYSTIALYTKTEIQKPLFHHLRVFFLVFFLDENWKLKTENWWLMVCCASEVSQSKWTGGDFLKHWQSCSLENSNWGTSVTQIKVENIHNLSMRHIIIKNASSDIARSEHFSGW